MDYDPNNKLGIKSGQAGVVAEESFMDPQGKQSMQGIEYIVTLATPTEYRDLLETTRSLRDYLDQVNFANNLVTMIKVDAEEPLKVGFSEDYFNEFKASQENPFASLVKYNELLSDVIYEFECNEDKECTFAYLLNSPEDL